MAQGQVLGVVMKIFDEEIVGEILDFLSKKGRIIYVKTVSPDYILLVKKIPKQVWRNESQINE